MQVFITNLVMLLYIVTNTLLFKSKYALLIK